MCKNTTTTTITIDFKNTINNICYNTLINICYNTSYCTAPCNNITLLFYIVTAVLIGPLLSVRCCVTLLQCIRGNSAVQLSAVIGGSVACWGLQQVSLHLQCYSDSQLLLAVQLMMMLLFNGAVSLQVHRNLFPLLPSLSSPLSELVCLETQWTLSILSAVRLSSACTDDSPWHCMQNSMVWGLTCITPNLKSPPRIHWKLITIHGRYVAPEPRKTQSSLQAVWLESTKMTGGYRWQRLWEWCSVRYRTADVSVSVFQQGDHILSIFSFQEQPWWLIGSD